MNIIEAGYYLIFSGTVKRTFGKYAAQCGFKYKNRGFNNWRFSRINEYDAEELVEITIRFGVNAEVRMDATLDIYGEPYSFLDGYEFEDITDFEEVISKFGETLKTQGELFFKGRRDKSPYKFSIRDLHMSLYHNYSLLKMQCERRNEFNKEVSLEKICDSIDKELEKMGNHAYDQSMKETFLQLAALIGEAYAQEYGWKWEEKNGYAYLMDKKNRCCFDPIEAILVGWEYKDHNVVKQYQRIKEQYGNGSKNTQ